MGNNGKIAETKRNNKIRIAKYISSKGITSKAEIANALGLSMPTTLQNVKELIMEGIVRENGVYESTGGRKAKAISIAPDIGYVIGIDITNHHITIVLVNMKKELLQIERIRKTFAPDFAYYETLGELIRNFILKVKVMDEKILGVGISLPGIVDREQKVLIRSHTLGVSNVSFKSLAEFVDFDFALENDANSAAYAELGSETENTVYLSLSNTVGGAIFLHDRLYLGENFKSAEFGHMVIEKDGRTCYCGKKGCVDAYCAAKVLMEHGDGSLEIFFDRLRKNDAKCLGVWDEYLEYLALTITNLRMAFDCNIILGGYVGGYLEEFRMDLNKRVVKYNNFDIDTSYIRTGRYKLEASAYGVTMGFTDTFFDLSLIHI